MAAIFGFLILGETLTFLELFGACIIFSMGILVSLTVVDNEDQRDDSFILQEMIVT